MADKHQSVRSALLCSVPFYYVMFYSVLECFVSICLSGLPSMSCRLSVVSLPKSSETAGKGSRPLPYSCSYRV